MYILQTRQPTLYSCRAIDELCDKLEQIGYKFIQLRDGTLGCGDIAIIAPDDKHYNFIIREVALNEWSSAHTVRRTMKISKALQAEINAVYGYSI